MGWYYTHGATLADVIRELTREETRDGFTIRTLAHALRGPVLWTVQESGEPGNVRRFVGCYLLRRTKHEAGYKPMDESMGPVDVSCPLSFLDMVPDPGGYATEWRAKVRAYHARVNRKLRVGDVVKLRSRDVPEVTVTTLRPLRGVFHGVTYRVPRRLLA